MLNSTSSKANAVVGIKHGLTDEIKDLKRKRDLLYGCKILVSKNTKRMIIEFNLPELAELCAAFSYGCFHACCNGHVGHGQDEY